MLESALYRGHRAPSRQMPARQRLARALAPELDQLIGAMKLIERTRVPRNRNQEIRRLGGELEPRDRLLHRIERAREQLECAGLGCRGIALALFHHRLHE